MAWIDELILDEWPEVFIPIEEIEKDEPDDFNYQYPAHSIDWGHLIETANEYDKRADNKRIKERATQLCKIIIEKEFYKAWNREDTLILIRKLNMLFPGRSTYENGVIKKTIFETLREKFVDYGVEQTKNQRKKDREYINNLSASLKNASYKVPKKGS